MQRIFCIIWTHTFSNCTSLTSLYIPASVAQIDLYGWGEGIIAGGTPPENCVIYCEAESKPSAWSKYWNCRSSESDKYEVVETQSKNGYILFLYGSRYYLLTVTRRYQNQTEVKVMPQNSDFSQGSVVAKEIFKLIDAKLLTQLMEQIK